jgi:ankyrin repeat protein
VFVSKLQKVVVSLHETSALFRVEILLAIERELVGRFIDAAVNNPSEALRLLGSNPDLRTAHWNLGQSALHFLAIESRADAVSLLLQNGWDPNAVNEFGDTPLIDACLLGNIEIAKLLLENGADPNATSDTHDNALHCCIRNGNAGLLDLLISSGADPQYITSLGDTIFDNWPNNPKKQNALTEALAKHNVHRITK